MKRLSIFVKIIFAFLLISILPTLFFGSLIILSYNNLIGEYHSLIESRGIGLGESFLVGTVTLQEKIKVQILLTFFLIVILVAFSFVMVFRNIVSPLKGLTEATKKVSSGELKVEIKAKSKDEIGELITSFNKMIADLASTKEQLEEEKKSLEVRVKARTLALEEEKTSLEERVRARTRELQERVEELESFHRLAVGRELKMVELKEEVRRLKRALRAAQK